MKLTGKTQIEIDAEKVAQEKETDKQNIINRLDEIDKATIRGLRAIKAGTQTTADTEKLINLETEATNLRNQLKEM